MNAKFQSKWTALYLFVIFNTITLVLFLLTNIATTLLLKRSQSEQIYLENRNNILLADMRSLHTSLSLRVHRDFETIFIKDESGTVVNSFQSTINATSTHKNINPLLYGQISYPIYFDEDQKNLYGEMIFVYKRVTSTLYFFGMWFVLLLLSIPIVIKVGRIIELKIKRNLEHQKLIAIGQTTSMLAHDVRKPFSTIKSVLNMFDELKDNPEELRQAKQAINKSIKNVEAMIADIMDYSREVKLETAPVDIAKLLDSAITQTVRSYPDADINFRYELNNQADPLVDEERILRVFANIIGNAVEAITVIGKKDQGTIFFRSADAGSGTVKIYIGNDGPTFNKEDIPKLFESFFTKGKKKGTGLGLASVQKIVQLHDGDINAENLPGGEGVQFVITLPASINSSGEKSRTALPTNVRDLGVLNTKQEVPVIPTVATTEQHTHGQSSVTILLLEDEEIYRASVRSVIRKAAVELKREIKIVESSKVNEALQLLKENKINYVISDIDLGEELNGFDFVRMAVAKYPEIKILVHSNRCIQTDIDLAKTLGAVGFAPKPLEMIHIETLLHGGSITSSPDSTVAQSPLCAVLIDDDEYIRRDWQRHAKKSGVTLYAYESPDELLVQKKLLDKEMCEIYIDRELGDNCPKGEVVAAQLYSEGFKKISLATSHDPDIFAHLPWLKVQGKVCPWSDEEDDW